MIEIWFRFRFLILYITFVIVCATLSIYNETPTYFLFAIFSPIMFLFYYAQVVTKLDLMKKSDNRKLSSVKHNFNSCKNLTITSFYLMNADGKISDNEIKYFKDFLHNEFNRKLMVNYCIKKFGQNKFTSYTLKYSCEKLIKKLRTIGKVQLLHYYISLITKDKFLSIGEIALLRKICKYSGIHYKTLDAVLAMFNYTSEEDLNKKTYAKTYETNSIKKYYTILEIEETATEEEIKTAYRNLVKTYHPDKQIGKEKLNLNLAKQKFQAIQEAYDKIKQQKGI